MSRGVGYDFKSSGGPTEITYLQIHTKCYYLSPIFFWEPFFGPSNLHVEVIVQNLKLRGSFWDVEPFFGHILKKWDGTMQRTFCCLSCCWFGKLGELGFFIWNADMLITSKPQNGRWAFEKDQHDSSYHTKKIPHSHPHHFQHQIFTIPTSGFVKSYSQFDNGCLLCNLCKRLHRCLRTIVQMGSSSFNQIKENITWYYYPMIIPWLSHYYPLWSIVFFPVLVRRRYAGRDLPWLWAGENPSAVAYQSNRPDGGPVGDWNQMQNRQTLEFYMCICIGKDCKRNFGML